MHFNCVLCCLYLASRWYKYASAGFTVFGFYLIAKHAFLHIMERRRHWELKKRYNSENSHEWFVCKLWWFAFFFFFFLVAKWEHGRRCNVCILFWAIPPFVLGKECYMLHALDFIFALVEASFSIETIPMHAIWWALLYTIRGSLIDYPFIHGLKFENMNWLTCIWIGWVVILYNFHSVWMFIIMALV